MGYTFTEFRFVQDALLVLFRAAVIYNIFDRSATVVVNRFLFKSGAGFPLKSMLRLRLGTLIFYWEKALGSEKTSGGLDDGFVCDSSPLGY